MKKAYLENECCVFSIYDSETHDKIKDVNPGDIEGDIDWDLVDEQANEEGYTIF